MEVVISNKVKTGQLQQLADAAKLMRGAAFDVYSCKIPNLLRFQSNLSIESIGRV